MAEEKTGETTPEQTGVSEDELKAMFRSQVKEELDERGLTKEILEKVGKLDILDSLEGLFEKNKAGGIDKDSLLGEIGNLIDSKLKGLPVGNGKAERTPKIRIFS